MSDSQREELLGKSTSRTRTTGGRQPNPMYELFVLGELMVQPMHGYLLHEVVNMILGPFHRLSWGTLYPLIRRLEQEGLITSQIEKRRGEFLLAERGPSRKVYTLTEAGRARFFSLILDPGDYNPDYPNLFAMKFSKFGYLTPPQRLAILEHYRTYLLTLRDHYRTLNHQVPHDPEVREAERPYIMRFLESRVHIFEEELAWLDQQIAELTND